MINKKYIALTIGPIYKTLSNAKKTRELWAGSYIFSYIMKKIIESFKYRTFITPNITDGTIFDQINEVGLFHDRFIFESKEGDFDKLKEIINNVLDKIGKDIFEHLKQNKKYKDKFDEDKDKNNVKNFIKNYFSLNFIEKELEEKENPILELSKYLDTIEQYNKPTPEGENYLSSFFKISNGSFLVKDALGQDNKKFDIKSLPKIASKELKPQDKSIFDKENDTDTYTELKKLVNFKNYHKYIAIVHADGDNFTEVLKNNGKNLASISKKLFEFAKESHKFIKDYGGMTIYAGGDDLLFFAPVKNENQTIFDLLDNISYIFDKKFEDENKCIPQKDPKATVSFGLSISYYKFPLYEALELSRNLLFKAKELPKNNIAFQVIKHSGQSFEGILNKKSLIYEKFKNLLEKILISNSNEIKFLGSFHHKFHDSYFILEQIFNDKIRLQNYFDNYFNEDDHVQNKKFFEVLVDFIYEVSQPSVEDKKSLIYGVLRFIKFMKGDEE